MPRKMSIEEAHEFLDSKPGWIALTTISPDGYPHAVDHSLVWQRAWTSTPPTAQTQGEIDSRRNRPAQLFEARFALKTAHKDLGFGEELAEAYEVRMPLTQVCRDLYSQDEQGLG